MAELDERVTEIVRNGAKTVCVDQVMKRLDVLRAVNFFLNVNVPKKYIAE